MNRSTRFGPVFVSLAFLLGGCSGDAEKAAEGGQAAAQEAPPVDFAGEWTAVDPDLGSLKLTVEGQDEDLKCVLIDVRGKRFEFEEEAEFEEDRWRFETELDVGERGVKILFNRPETSLEVAGDMNYAMGSVVLACSREQRDGVEVVALAIYRESRPQDTRRAINLQRSSPAPAPAGE